MPSKVIECLKCGSPGRNNPDCEDCLYFQKLYGTPASRRFAAKRLQERNQRAYKRRKKFTILGLSVALSPAVFVAAVFFTILAVAMGPIVWIMVAVVFGCYALGFYLVHKGQQSR